MNKLDILFIRACKTNNTRQRIRSLYKRFYLIDSDIDRHLIVVLSELVDKYSPMKTVDVLNRISPSNSLMFKSEEYNFEDACLEMLIGRIRFMDTSCLKGFIIPAMFRN